MNRLELYIALLIFCGVCGYLGAGVWGAIGLFVALGILLALYRWFVERERQILGAQRLLLGYMGCEAGRSPADSFRVLRELDRGLANAVCARYGHADTTEAARPHTFPLQSEKDPRQIRNRVEGFWRLEQSDVTVYDGEANVDAPTMTALWDAWLLLHGDGASRHPRPL